MLVRYTIGTAIFALTLASVADAQLQQPASLQRPDASASTRQRTNLAPQPPHALAVLRETVDQSASTRLMPIVFQDVAPPGAIAAPGYAEPVPQPQADGGKGKGYCSACNGHDGCGCGRGLRGRIRHHHMYYFGYDPEAWVEPFGTNTVSHLEKQVASGVAARMTLYAYDFDTSAAGKTVKLNPRGWQQLAKCVDLANRSDFPIVIESSPYSKGDEPMRRQAVLDALRAMGSTVAADRVVVTQPVARGLSGDESMIIYDNLLQQTQARGVVVGSVNFTSGSSSSDSDSDDSE